MLHGCIDGEWAKQEQMALTLHRATTSFFQQSGGCVLVMGKPGSALVSQGPSRVQQLLSEGAKDDIRPLWHKEDVSKAAAC